MFDVFMYSDLFIWWEW